MAYFSSRYMITDGVKMTEVALGLRYFHPSCFHPFSRFKFLSGLDSQVSLECSSRVFKKKIKFPKMSADVKKSIRHESI